MPASLRARAVPGKSRQASLPACQPWPSPRSHPPDLAVYLPSGAAINRTSFHAFADSDLPMGIWPYQYRNLKNTCEQMVKPYRY